MPGRGPRRATDGRIVATVDSRRRDLPRPTMARRSLERVLLRPRAQRRLKFATNASFSRKEPGGATKARYGAVRVAPDGELLPTGLRDKDLQPL